MKYRRLLAASAAVFSALALGWHALGQGVPAAAPPRAAVAPRPSSVALLNVGYLFENHPRLTQMRADMKRDVEQADAAVKAKQENIKKLAEKLDQYKGTPDFKAIEEEVAKRSSDLKLEVAMQRKDFMLREARMYHQTYQEIHDEVQYYCQQNGVDLVLRFNAEKVDLDNPESVLVHVNRPIIYYSTERDITGIVLQTINARYRPAPRDSTVIPGPPFVPSKR